MAWCIVRDSVAMDSVEWEAAFPTLAPEQLGRVLAEMDGYVASHRTSTAGCRLLSASGTPITIRLLSEAGLPDFCNHGANGEFEFQLAVLPGFNCTELRGQTRVISFGSRFALMTGKVTLPEIRDALAHIAAFYLPDLGILPLCGSLVARSGEGASTLYLGRTEWREKILKASGMAAVNSDCGLAWSGAGIFPLDPEQSTLYAHPSNVVIVIADGTGVLPPISMLTNDRAAHYFQSGCHQQEPIGFHLCLGSSATFRTVRACASLLARRLEAQHPRCWMLNLGSLGGPRGKPIDKGVSVSLLKAALNGTLAKMSFQFDANFHLFVPVSCPGVPSVALDQRANWVHPGDYDVAAKSAAEILSRIS